MKNGHKFKVGDEVICVDLNHPLLTYGETYIIKALDWSVRGIPMVSIRIRGARLNTAEIFYESRFELKSKMKPGDMIEVSDYENFPMPKKRELLADLSGQGLTFSYICRDANHPTESLSWKFARPLKEPEIKLTVNGKDIPISKETLDAIKGEL